ncbi:hypothetical protein D3C71_1529690 [compost metagenome]
MHFEGLEQVGGLLVPLQRIVLEFAAKGDLRLLFMHPDRVAGPLGHGLRVVQAGVRHHVGHQHHGHVVLQGLADQVQQLRVARVVHAALAVVIRHVHAARQGQGKRQGGKSNARSRQRHGSGP